MIYIILILLALVIYQAERKQIAERRHKLEIEAARTDAVKRSKAVLKGGISEQIIPLLPDFPYNLPDCKFLGMPLDYIIFNGMTSLRNGNDTDMEIIFADVKYNTATLNSIQREAKRAIEAGRVRFETITINKENQIKIK